MATKFPTPSLALPSIKRHWIQHYLPIIPILLLGVGLYCYQLGAESFWIDELYSIEDAKLSITKLITGSTRPLYYIFLHVWMLLGSNEAWLRGLSIPFALGSILLIYELGSFLIGRSVGLIAALLMTLSPLFINHAQEVRMYSLSTFLGLAGTLALSHVLRKEKIVLAPVSWWLITRILAILTTPLNILLFLPDFVLLIGQLPRKRRILIAMGGLLVLLGIVILAWLSKQAAASLAFMDDWAINTPKPGFSNVIARLTSFTTRWPLRTVSPPFSHFYNLYTVMLGGLLGFVLWNRRRKTQLFWIAIWGFLPSATMFLVSWLLSPIWLPRYLLFVAPYFLLLLSAGLVTLWHQQQKLAILLVLVYFIAVVGGIKHYYTATYRADWRGVAQMISTEESPGDIIAACISHSRPQLALNHYYQGSLPIYIIEKSNNKEEQQKWCEDLPSFPYRLWLIYLDTTGDSEQFQIAVKEKFNLQKQQTFQSDLGVKNNIEVFLLKSNTPKTAIESSAI